MLGPESGHRNQHLAHTRSGRNPSVVEASEDHLHQSLGDQYFQGQEMTLDDPLGYQTATTGLSYQADNSPSLDSLLEFETFDREASHFSNSRPGQDPLQSSHDIYQDAVYAPSLSPELFHVQHGDLTKDGPEVLPLRGQFGTHQQANFFSDLVPDVYTGVPDQLNYQDHNTGGLRLASSKNGGTLSKLRQMSSRISSRLRDL